MTGHPKKRWEPSQHFQDATHLQHFMQWLSEKGLIFAGYRDLWAWSTEHFEDFWSSLFEYFKVIHNGTVGKVISQQQMPGIQWFEGIELNYAEHIFRSKTDQFPAIISAAEHRGVHHLSWSELESKTAGLQSYLQSIGIKKGDRVAAYLPNIPEATIGLLATASIGAIWSSCSPDFGTQAVIDRFSQIQPRVLIAVAGYAYGGKSFDKNLVVSDVVEAVPSIESVILIDDKAPSGTRWKLWKDVVTPGPSEITFERVGFNDPLWVLYSSGTTGLPKAITHSHGGILLEQLKYLSFHQDVHPGDRCFWYTTTGWMMWNYLQGVLLCGGTIVLYDGSPAYPDLQVLWRLSADVQINHFGASAGYILACAKSGLQPAREHDLKALRSIGSTGSTLPPEGFAWVYENAGKELWLTSMSGGTDVCSAFVGGNPLWPVYEGEIQCRALGCKLEAWDEEGHAIRGEGEMVITSPMPCMPIFFWNDPQFSRYRESYFDRYPGVWRHGDWIEITAREGIIIYGRSDATLNRAGVRIGTSEIYRALDKIPEIKDGLIICIEKSGGEFYMPLFVVLQEGLVLSEALKKRINRQLKTEYSPRHVPDEIHQAPDIPYTISGKKTEMPIKKIMMGKDIRSTVSKGSLRNPQSLDFFVGFYQSNQTP